MIEIQTTDKRITELGPEFIILNRGGMTTSDLDPNGNYFWILWGTTQLPEGKAQELLDRGVAKEVESEDWITGEKGSYISIDFSKIGKN